MQYFWLSGALFSLMCNNDIAFGLEVDFHNQGNHRLLSAQSSPNQIAFKWVKGRRSGLPVPKYNQPFSPSCSQTNSTLLTLADSVMENISVQNKIGL